MPNIILTGDLIFPIIDSQMETADGGTDENQVQGNAFLQYAQEQCLLQYIVEPTRINNILYVFLSNNNQLTRQIIITETSMSDQNITQIETNIKIVEEKQNHRIKKRNLGYRGLNFFSEDISWASIDADLLMKSWDTLLTDVKTVEMYKIIINICLEICKKHVLSKKSPRKHQIPRERMALMRKISKLQKKIQRSTNHQTKENVLNQIKEIENNLKISINTEINLRETRDIAAIKKKKILDKFVKHNSTNRAGIDPLQDEEGNLEPSNKKKGANY